MKLPIGIAELDYATLPVKDRKSALAYAKWRVRTIKRAQKEAEKLGFRFFKDFLHGRECEAMEILEFIKLLEKKRK